MQRYKRILILLGVLVVALAVTFGVSRYQEAQEKIAASDEIILEIPTEDVTALSWVTDDASFSFHRDGTWSYDDDEAFPVSEEKMEELLSPFASLGAAFIIEDVEDFDQYGLEEPTCTITVETGEETYTIDLGAFSTMDAQRYVSIGDGNVYLVSTDPMDYYDATLSELIDNDEIPAFDTVDSMTFSGEADYTLRYEEGNPRAYSEDDVYFTQVDGQDLPLDTSLVNTYLSTLSYLDLSTYVSYNVSDEELETYGLASPELTVEVAYTVEDEDGEASSNTFSISLSRDPAQKAAEETEATEEAEDTATEETEEEEFLAYARIGDSQIVYQLTESDYLSLMNASYDDLRHQAVLPVDISEVTELSITLEGKDYLVTSEVMEEDGEEVRKFYLDGEELDVEALQNALTALTADSFTNETPSGDEEIRLTLTLDNENYPTMTLAFYRYNGTLCLAEVDGTPVCLVSRSAVVDLVEAVQAFALN